MKNIFQFLKLLNLYNFFLLIALLNIFFSTENCAAKNFVINDVEISTPFEINFNKNKIIDQGFVQAFGQLVAATVKSSDQKKLKKISLQQIKGMIETFSIKEEKFVNETYNLILSVSFNKKNLFKLLENENIFPSLPIKKNLIFIPIIVDEDKNEIQMFSENKLYNIWNSKSKKYDLLNYILPTEDLEDFNLIKRNIKNLENYDFDKIVIKYDIQDYIVAIFYNNYDEIKLLSKIKFNNKLKLKNRKLNKFDISNEIEINKFIENLKIEYEDFWKSQNEINTSIKMPLTISIENNNNIKVGQFEKDLANIDLIYNFYIYKFNNNNNIYKVIFNGSPSKFLEIMNEKNYKFETKNRVWVLK